MQTIKLLLKDTRQLSIFIIISIALFAFINLAALVMAESTLAIDTRLLLLFREQNDLSDPLGPKWVEEMMRDITALGGVGMLVIVTLVVTIFLLIIKKPKAALLVLIGIATGMLVSFSLKYGYSRPRPDLVPHGSYVYTSSFPSGHAMMSSLVYFTIAGLLAQQNTQQRIRIFMFTLATFITLAIGVSRVYLGVHYPSDVIAGWIVGTSWAMLIYFVYRWSHLRRKHLV
ncbi:phosphatase PAP2 family protein [Glaciecola sp. 2405UD65-10]|uniref:phosphatase PAP2 family protein n=1 Tax=Glaciecola sp. 2405UD65-10 TaxID=3397244 RepID=UPI003B5B6165